MIYRHIISLIVLIRKIDMILRKRKNCISINNNSVGVGGGEEMVSLRLPNLRNLRGSLG